MLPKLFAFVALIVFLIAPVDAGKRTPPPATSQQVQLAMFSTEAAAQVRLTIFPATVSRCGARLAGVCHVAGSQSKTAAFNRSARLIISFVCDA